MEKHNMFFNEVNTNSLTYGNEMDHEENEMNSSNFFNPNNWDINTMDQNDPFESALSSMVSSPTASNATANGKNIVLRELIGRLGTIGENSGEVDVNNSTNTSCYSTPLNSPPKLKLSMMENRGQFRGNSQIPGKHFPPFSSKFSPFSTDPGLAERAAVFSSFATRNSNSHLGLDRMTPKLNSGSNNFVKVQEKGGILDSRENSSVSEPIPGAQNDANSRKRKSNPKGKGKGKETPSKSTNVGSDNSELRSKRNKSDDEMDNDDSKIVEAPKDYIHVRARRGQATDAHSLAERVRREKIGERMKVLQDLVPGCDKVTGKAIMLDEIINYVQSLQRQVEFLSMKLATVDPRMDSNMEVVMSKNVMFQSQAGSNLLYTSTPNLTDATFPENHFFAVLGRNQSMQLQNYGETSSQVSTFWADDLHCVVQMGFGQNQDENLQGTTTMGQMKVES